MREGCRHRNIGTRISVGWGMFICFSVGFLILIACDPEGKKDCAWVLEPEPDLQDKVEKGYIPVCARNRQTMKQDCRFQTTIDEARKYRGRTFRYEDLKVVSFALPRTIRSVKFCQPGRSGKAG